MTFNIESYHHIQGPISMCDFFHFCTFLCNLLDQFFFFCSIYIQFPSMVGNCCYAFYGAHPFLNRSSSFLASRYKKQCRAEITIQFCFGITIPHTLINMKFLVSHGILFHTYALCHLGIQHTEMEHFSDFEVAMTHCTTILGCSLLRGICPGS